jgi:hypothetical protein
MKMLKQLSAVAIMVVAMLVPTSVVAKTDINLDILNPAGLALGGNPGAADDAVAQALNKHLSDAEAQLTTNKEEQKLRDEVGGLRDKNDRRKMTDDLITAYKNSVTNASKSTNQAMEALYGKLGNSAGPGVSAADTDTSEVSGVCTQGVDLAQFASLDAQMRSEPVNYLRKEGGKALADAKKDEKKADLAKYMQLIKAVKEKNKQRDAESAEPKVEDSLAYLHTAKPDGLDDKHRIDRLTSDKKKLAAELETGTDKQLDEVTKIYIAMMDPDADEKGDISAITGPFVQNLQAYRKSLQDTANKAVAKAYKNCQAEATKVGRDQPLSPASMLNKAYQSVLAFYGGDPNSYASTFLNQLSAEARLMQCNKATAKVEEQLGAKMQAQIAQLEGVKDRKAFLEGVLATMTALGKASSEVGKSLKKPLEQCDKIAKFEEKLEQFVGNVQQHMQQQQQGGQQNGQQASGTRGTPAGNQIAHSGAPQQTAGRRN